VGSRNYSQLPTPYLQVKEKTMELQIEIRKITSVVVSLAVIFLCVPCICQLSAAPVAAVITTVKGEVQVIPNQKTTSKPAKVGDFVYEGDTVKTLKGAQAAITFTNGAVIKLNQNTEFLIDVTGSIADIGSRIKMKTGKLWSKVRPKSKFEIETPVAIVAVRGTEFETNLAGGRLDLSVFSGIVNVKNKFGEVDVKEGKKTTVSGDNPPEPPTDLKDKNKPAWQDELETKNTVKMELALTSVDADAVNDINISVVDANGNVDEKYDGYIDLKSDNIQTVFSQDGTKWVNELKTDAVKGRLGAKIKFGAAGEITLSASADKATSCIAKISVKSNVKKLKLNIESKTGTRNITIKFKKK